MKGKRDLLELSSPSVWFCMFFLDGSFLNVFFFFTFTASALFYQSRPFMCNLRFSHIIGKIWKHSNCSFMNRLFSSNPVQTDKK